MKYLLISLVLITVNFISVGSGTAYLKCKSDSGKTLFIANVTDIDGSLEKAELSIDGAKISFDESDEIQIIFDPKNGVYTISLKSKPSAESERKFLKLWAIPKTFKIIKESSGESKYEFCAKLYATEPRKDKEKQTPEITVICQLEYRI